MSYKNSISNTKSAFASAFFLLMFSFGSAQEITMSPELDLKGELVEILGADEQGFYALEHVSPGLFSSRPGEYFILGFDRSFNLLFRKSIPFPENARTLHLERSYFINGRFYLIASHLNKRDNINSAYAFIVNSSDRQLEKSLEIDRIQAHKRRRIGSFDFALSYDSSKLMVFHNEPYEKNEEERFAFKIYDSGLNLLREQQVNLPYSDQDFFIDNIAVDNNGRAYMIGSLRKEREERKGRRNPNYKYIVFAFDENRKEPIEYSIDLEGRFVTDTRFQIDRDGNLRVYGFFSERDENSVKGLFYMRISSESAEIIDLFDKDLPPQLISDVNPDRLLRRGAEELVDFVIEDIIDYENKSSVLISEQGYVVSYTTYDQSGIPSTRYVFFRNDVILAKMNEKGDIKWVSRIPKRQSTSGLNLGEGFVAGRIGSQIAIIFNDARRNDRITDDKRLKYWSPNKKTRILLSTVQSDGTVVTSPLFEDQPKRNFITPAFSMDFGNNEMLLHYKRSPRSDRQFIIVKW